MTRQLAGKQGKRTLERLRALLFGTLLLGVGACSQSQAPLLADLTVYNTETVRFDAEVGEVATASWNVVNDGGTPLSYDAASTEAWLELGDVPATALLPGNELELELSAYCAAPGRYHAAVVLLSDREPERTAAVTLDCVAKAALEEGTQGGEEGAGETEEPVVTSPGELVRPYPNPPAAGDGGISDGETTAPAPQPELSLELP